MGFKALSEGEDARFCDLVRLVRRGYNTLKEVVIPSDMNNSDMLSIIERAPVIEKFGSENSSVKRS